MAMVFYKGCGKNMSVLLISLLMIGIAPVHAQNENPGSDTPQSQQTVNQPALKGTTDALQQQTRKESESKEEVLDQYTQYESQVKALPMTNDGYEAFEKLRSDFISQKFGFSRLRKNEPQLDIRHNEVARLFSRKKLKFLAIYPPTLDAHSKKCLDQLVQYESQVPSLPITLDGYATFQKLHSDFSNMLGGERTCFMEMVKNTDLLQANNVVAETFIARKQEFQAIQNSVSDNKKIAAEKELAALVAKYHSQIGSLGFSTAILKATIYLQVDAVNQPKKFITFKTWLAGLFESGKYSNVTRIKLKNSQGVLLKRPGMQSSGILFKMDGGDLFPTHITNSEEATPLESAGDQVAASMLMIDALEPNK